MADTQRPPHRGGGRGGRGEHRGGRGGGRGGHEGGGRGGHGGGGGGGERERPKKENILDLGKYMDKKITVKFTGGREGELLSFLFMSHHLYFLPACDEVGFVRLMWTGDLGSKCNERKMQKNFRIRAMLTAPSQ
jgi:hypothetical protein